MLRQLRIQYEGPARRLRRETPLTVDQLARRLCMGHRNTLNNLFYEAGKNPKGANCAKVRSDPFRGVGTYFCTIGRCENARDRRVRRMLLRRAQWPHKGHLGEWHILELPLK